MQLMVIKIDPLIPYFYVSVISWAYELMKYHDNSTHCMVVHDVYLFLIASKLPQSYLIYLNTLISSFVLHLYWRKVWITVISIALSVKRRLKVNHIGNLKSVLD